MLDMFGASHAKYMKSWMNVDHNFNQLHAHVLVAYLTDNYRQIISPDSLLAIDIEGV